jgi:Ca2+-transporting ATPase
MTGDGVNDAPALKKADVGIVVSSASDVSKGSADMVLLDDNFTTIVAAIEEGRGIFANLRKVILYLLSDSFAEVLLIVGSLVLRLPLPIRASQILWVNLIDDSLPSLALTMEPKEKGLMRALPRDPQTDLMDTQIKILIGVISAAAGLLTLLAFSLFFEGDGIHLDQARTVVFTMLGIDSLIYVFSCRSLQRPIWLDNFWKNPWLLGAVGVGLALQLAALYVPFLQEFLHTVPLGLTEWIWVLGFAAATLLLIEGVKAAFLYGRRSR